MKRNNEQPLIIHCSYKFIPLKKVQALTDRDEAKLTL